MNYKKPLVNKENRFSKAPPGYSLTQPPGKWSWEKPPQFTDPDSAVEALIKSVQRIAIINSSPVSTTSDFSDDIGLAIPGHIAREHAANWAL